MATIPPTIPAAYDLTFADWLKFPDGGREYEIIGGELFMSPSTSIQHQRISRTLLVALHEYLRVTNAGEVFHAPTGVKLSERDVPQPDLLVVLSAHADRTGELVIEGAPDLVVEILSPGTAGRDLEIKRDLYARSGVAEYWIVHPVASEVEVLVLDPERSYQTFARFQGDQVLRSPLLSGFLLRLADLFA